MNALAITISDVLIRQDNAGRYCLNDLHVASGSEAKHKPANFLRNQQAIDLVELLKSEKLEPVNVINGIGTLAIKEVVYAYAMWISAAFTLKVIRAYDSLVSRQPLQLEPPTITKAQIGVLYNRVAAISSGSGKIRAELWSRFQNHFKLSSYKDLPTELYDEAIAYLDAKQIEYAGEDVEMLYLSSKELDARVQERVTALQGELLTKPEPAENTLSITFNKSICDKRYVMYQRDDNFVIKPMETGQFVTSSEKLASLIADPMGGNINFMHLGDIAEAAISRMNKARKAAKI